MKKNKKKDKKTKSDMFRQTQSEMDRLEYNRDFQDSVDRANEKGDVGPWGGSAPCY